MKRTLLVLALAAASHGCGESSQEKAMQRMAHAESRLDACKKEIGVPAAPTPETTALFDSNSQGKPLTAERLVEMRVKVECLAPLHDLLEARRAAGIKN